MPFLETDARTPAKAQTGRLVRARAQLLIAVRLLAKEHLSVASYMAEHAQASLADYIEKERAVNQPMP